MDNGTPYVLFVCEHGSAKSVVAAVHFNRLANDNGLGIQAISRGTNPDAEIPSNVLKGLEQDGLIPNKMQPELLRAVDFSDAICVVSFCDLPQYADGQSFVSWSDVPPVGDDYVIARDDITKRIDKLMAELR